jgi:hypothetical protein
LILNATAAKDSINELLVLALPESTIRLSGGETGLIGPADGVPRLSDLVVSGIVEITVTSVHFSGTDVRQISSNKAADFEMVSITLA